MNWRMVYGYIKKAKMWIMSIYNIDSSFKVLNKGLIILDQKGELGNKFRLLFQEQTFF